MSYFAYIYSIFFPLVAIRFSICIKIVFLKILHETYWWIVHIFYFCFKLCDKQYLVYMSVYSMLYKTQKKWPLPRVYNLKYSAVVCPYLALFSVLYNSADNDGVAIEEKKQSEPWCRDAIIQLIFKKISMIPHYSRAEMAWKH